MAQGNKVKNLLELLRVHYKLTRQSVFYDFISIYKEKSNLQEEIIRCLSQHFLIMCYKVSNGYSNYLNHYMLFCNILKDKRTISSVNYF